MSEDKELHKIAYMAIPLSECPRKRQQEIWRREKLVNRIKAYVAEQLEKQFNAKEYAARDERGGQLADHDSFKF